jgi:hypothetical protein
MTINCLPTGENINTGFSCEASDGVFNSLITMDDGNGGLIYVDRAISGADIFMCFFIFIFLIFFMLKTMFYFFLPKIISIKKKQ